MIRIGVWLAGMALLAGLTACEQQETPTGGGAATATQPAEKTAGTAGKSEAVPDVGTAVESVKQKAQQTATAAAGAAGDIIRQVREKYQKLTEGELAKLDQQIQDMKSKLGQAAADARPEMEKRITELTQRVQAARQMLEKMARESDQAWDQAKKSMEATLKDLKSALGETTAAPPPASQPASKPVP